MRPTLLVLLALFSVGCGSERRCEVVINEVCFSGYQGYLSEEQLALVALAPKAAAQAVGESFDRFLLDRPFEVVFDDLSADTEGEYSCGDATLTLNKRWVDTEAQRCNIAGVTLGHEWLHHYATEVLGHDCSRGDGLKGHNVPWVFFKWARKNGVYNDQVAEYQSFTTAGHACGLYEE